MSSTHTYSNGVNVLKFVHINDYDAIEQSDGSWLHSDGEVYWYNEEGVVHREDGPAITYPTGEINWFLNGIEIDTFNEWCIVANKTDEEKMLLRLQYG
jgi:hypothetical protein